MSILFKKKENQYGLRSEILLGAISIEPFFAKLGVNLVVTSGAESYKHSAIRSAHYRGDAIDVRTKHLPKSVNKKEFVKKIKRKLGKNFVVILEGEGKVWEHIHIHWSPIFE